MYISCSALNITLNCPQDPKTAWALTRLGKIATAGLQNALDENGIEYTINEGDGAFYGTKIDFHLEDSIGRTWQCGTIQLDMQMPERFELEYTAADGTKKRPVMIHRVCFGSIERFIGILIEHFAGQFPVWLSPVQVKVLPISEKFADYAKSVEDALDAAGIRVETDNRAEKDWLQNQRGKKRKSTLYHCCGGKGSGSKHGFPCVPERTARRVRLLWQISLQESRKKSIQRFWIDFL